MANIKLNLPAEPFSGQIVTFKALCASSEITDGLIINGETYAVCNALGECVTGISGSWDSGALVSIILNVEDKKAYVQNNAVTAESIGAAPMYTYGTDDLTAGSSALETGKLHFVYE